MTLSKGPDRVASKAPLSTMLRGLVGAVFLLALMALSAQLPFVPSWQPARMAIIVAGTISALACLLFASGKAWHENHAPARRRQIAAAAVTLGVGMLAVAWLVMASVYGVSNLRGRDLVAVVHVPRERVIFVYEVSEIPDGVVAAEVTMREGWLPFERPLLTVAARFEQARREPEQLLLSFGRSGTAYYTFADGKIKFVEP